MIATEMKAQTVLSCETALTPAREIVVPKEAC